MKTNKITPLLLACILYVGKLSLLAQTPPLFNRYSYYTISCKHQDKTYYLQAELFNSDSGVVTDLDANIKPDSTYLWQIEPFYLPGYDSCYFINSLASGNNKARMMWNGKNTITKTGIFSFYSPSTKWKFTDLKNGCFLISNRSAGQNEYLTLGGNDNVGPVMQTGISASTLWTITEVSLSSASYCNVTNNSALISSVLVGGYNSIPFVEQGIRYFEIGGKGDTIKMVMGKTFAASFNVALNGLSDGRDYYFETYYTWAKGVTLTTPMYFKTKDKPEKTPAWGYSNTNWVCDYSECGGAIQSPVALSETNSLPITLPPFKTNYNPFPCKLIDNGHSLYVSNTEYKIENSITFNNRVYHFMQMHFHTPSEHAINGKFGSMEVHIVHNDPYTNALLVLAVMLKDEGDSNLKAYTLLDKLYKNWPSVSRQVSPTEVYTQFASVLSRGSVAGVNVNMNDLVPAGSKFFMYTGSLTTPPCWQGVTFLVCKDFIPVGKSLSEAFAKKFHYNNARPVQSINNRVPLISK